MKINFEVRSILIAKVAKCDHPIASMYGIVVSYTVIPTCKPYKSTIHVGKYAIVPWMVWKWLAPTL